MAATKTNTRSADIVALPVRPSIKEIAAMSKAEREAYIASRTGAQPQDIELDVSALTKHYAAQAISSLGRTVGTIKEIGAGASSAFMAGYLSALDD